MSRKSFAGTLKSPTLIAVAAIVFFFGGLGAWSVLAPLSSATLAPGEISPLDNRKTVQHLEGGIIERILVTEGSTVRAGEPLLLLVNAKAKSEVGVLASRQRELAAELARLEAERRQLPRIAFPAVLDESDPKSASAMARQRELFTVRRRNLAERIEIIKQQRASLEAGVEGYRAMRGSLVRQTSLIEEELADVKKLLLKGLAKKSRYLALEREKARIVGEISRTDAAVSESLEEIGRLSLSIENEGTAFQAEVEEKYVEAQTKLGEAEEQLWAATDVIERTIVRAPQDGTVVDLRFHTSGGVIPPSEPILDLVPAEDDLVVKARVSPLDIEAVAPGLKAKVYLVAYTQRTLPQIYGEVQTVSADRLVEEANGDSYYLVQIRIDAGELSRLAPDVELVAGMPTEVAIVNGERTFLDYLMRPIVDSFRRSFTET